MLRKAFSPNFALFVRLSTSSWYPLSKALNKLDLSSGEAFLKSVYSIVCDLSGILSSPNKNRRGEYRKEQQSYDNHIWFKKFTWD
jgi:hypothetical protein